MGSMATLVACGIAVLLALCMPRPALSFSKGPPLSACKEMVPRHSAGPTFTHHNFQLVVDRGIRERRVTVQLLTTSSNVTFRGFLIRSMAVRGSSFIYFRGIFEKDTQFQDSLYLDCDGQDRSAISHGDNKTKKEVVVHWRPEPDPKNLVQVFFRATVVQNFNRYFIHLDSIRLLFGTAGPSTFGRLSFVGLLGSCVAPAAVALFYAWME